MKQAGTKPRRPVVVILCVVLRVGRRVRGTCAPYARGPRRWLSALRASDAGLQAHVVVAVVSTAAFALGAAYAGAGASELCKLVGAVVVGALAVSAASTLIRRQLGRGPRALRPVLATTVLTVVGQHARLPAARVLGVVLGPPRSLAAASLGVALAALAPPLDGVERPALLGLAVLPARRWLPALGVALDAHDAYRDCLESARFVRSFAETAAALYPEPRAARALPAPCA